MKRISVAIFLLFGMAGLARAQPTPLPQIYWVLTAPTIGAACTVAQPLNPQFVVSTLAEYACEGPALNGMGTWQLVTGGGGGSGNCPATGSANEIQTYSDSTHCASSPATADSSGNVAATSLATGTAPPLVTAGTAGVSALKEGTPPSVGPASGVDLCYADSTLHQLLCSANNGPYLSIVPVTTVTTGTSATLSTAFTVNEEATAATAVTYTLPGASSGAQFCVDNGNNGSAANTGVLTLATSTTGQFIVFTDGTLSATGGNVTSGGAARDGACVYGIDSTHWMFLPHSGTWTKH